MNQQCNTGVASHHGSNTDMTNLRKHRCRFRQVVLYYGVLVSGMYLLVKSLLLLEESIHAPSLLVALGAHLLELSEGLLQLLLHGPQLGLLLGLGLAGRPVPVLRTLDRLQSSNEAMKRDRTGTGW